ncbi:MAG: SDR family oxidoreductase [Gammaproteobacteria bacterium]|nr:SDR family oxidoreductase [Gammaproteobacteria bacterium]
MSQPVTLITGTRKGIGRYLAEHFVARDHQVIGCSRSPTDWDTPGYQHFELDVCDEIAVRSMFSAIRKSHGRLDNLINNAGIASMNHSLLTPLKTVERILEVNLVGTFLFCREAAKLMQRARHGRIVNFTTVAVPLKLEGEAAYVASKAGVKSLTDVLAREYASSGITVNSIGPTPIDTDLIRAVPKQKIDELVARQAIKRLGRCEDVANVIDFYLREESDFITGQHLFLGGL